jgi:HAD superfamily hydrolase (TIGR01509 family)
VLRAVIFDFDGLVLETEEPIYRAHAEVYRDHGHELSLEFWKTTVGTDTFDPDADLEIRLGRPLDRAAIEAVRTRRTDELLAGREVLPGVLDLRDRARKAGLKLAIASSSSRRWVVGHLERLGIATGWDCIVCREDAPLAKPDPGLYLAALACLGVRAEAAVAIEDSGHGVAAAAGAGIRCVVVPSVMTRGADFTAADLVAESLAAVQLEDLARLVERVPREFISTLRLRLEPIGPEHAAGIHAAATSSLAELRPWMPWAVNLSPDAVRELAAAAPARWEAGREHHFAIIREGSVLGVVGLNREAPGVYELHYWIASYVAGAGLVTEAAAAVLAWARDRLPLQRFTLWAGSENQASRRVAEKLGFQHIGPLPDLKAGGYGPFPAELYELTGL